MFAQKLFHLCVMSLLGVPSRPFSSLPTCSLTRPSASSTPLTGTRRSPCVSPPWGGMSGHLANPTPGTNSEVDLCARSGVRLQKNRCMRCGRSSKHMRMQGTCEGLRWLREDSKHKLQRWCTQHVKSIPPTTENWLRKLYQYSKKNYKSTEDKHETNHINNKYNDTNMNTRKMHNT